jgi:serine/threonine protein kinase
MPSKKPKPQPEGEAHLYWPDVPLRDIADLPSLPKDATFHRQRFLAQSYHSQVYTLDLNLGGTTKRALLKLFSKELKHRYVREENAYRYLQHFGVIDQGLVPRIYGVVPSMNKKRLREVLGDAVPTDVVITPPASGIIMEYIEGAENPSIENMTQKLAQKILRGLRRIHFAHILHGDAEGRNIFIFPKTRKVVFIDFSSAEINLSKRAAIRERGPLKTYLYCDLVNYLPFIKTNRISWERLICL